MQLISCRIHASMVDGLDYPLFSMNPQPIISVCRYIYSSSFDKSLVCCLVGLWIKYSKLIFTNTGIEIVNTDIFITRIDKIDLSYQIWGIF